MASLMWNSASCVGVQAMDDQHGILLDALNELQMALLHGDDCATVMTMLTRVTELMRMHVKSEDRLLALHGFPGLDAQRAQHQQLLGRLAQFDTRFEQWQSGSAYELVKYLRKWFTSHTGAAGQSYGPWLHEHGVREYC